MSELPDRQHRSTSRGAASLAFFRGFLRNPEVVASVIPSSRFLERRVVEASELDRASLVVELGPGTGGTTSAILKAMPKDSKLLAIEMDGDFVELLRNAGDSRLIAHQGRAEDIQSILEEHGLDAPDVVISGIPFSTVPRTVGLTIVDAVWQSLAPNGCFVAYQFRGRVGELGSQIIGKPEVEFEPLNAPPMRVYRWRKNEAG